MTAEFVSELKTALRDRAAELEDQAKRLAEVTGYPASEMVVERRAMAAAFGTVLDAIEIEDAGLVRGREDGRK